MDNTIKNYFAQICEKFNLASSKEEAKSKLLDKYLVLDFNNSYGGYRFTFARVDSGGHSGAFGKSSACERMSKKVFIAYCQGLLQI